MPIPRLSRPTTATPGPPAELGDGRERDSCWRSAHRGLGLDLDAAFRAMREVTFNSRSDLPVGRFAYRELRCLNYFGYGPTVGDRNREGEYSVRAKDGHTGPRQGADRVVSPRPESRSRRCRFVGSYLLGGHSTL